MQGSCFPNGQKLLVHLPWAVFALLWIWSNVTWEYTKKVLSLHSMYNARLVCCVLWPVKSIEGPAIKPARRDLHFAVLKLEKQNYLWINLGDRKESSQFFFLSKVGVFSSSLIALFYELEKLLITYYLYNEWNVKQYKYNTKDIDLPFS